MTAAYSCLVSISCITSHVSHDASPVERLSHKFSILPLSSHTQVLGSEDTLRPLSTKGKSLAYLLSTSSLSTTNWSTYAVSANVPFGGTDEGSATEGVDVGEGTCHVMPCHSSFTCLLKARLLRGHQDRGPWSGMEWLRTSVCSAAPWCSIIASPTCAMIVGRAWKRQGVWPDATDHKRAQCHAIAMMPSQ